MRKAGLSSPHQGAYTIHKHAHAVHPIPTHALGAQPHPIHTIKLPIWFPHTTLRPCVGAGADDSGDAATDLVATSSYLDMLTDARRNAAYDAALRAQVGGGGGVRSSEGR
eukprot:360851-Chlamydomonas_euryale.AAC.2